jgi:hypothetical protein
LLVLPDQEVGIVREIVVDRPASEMSSLLAIENRRVLDAQGWSQGFWTCGDEGPVEKALGAIGRSSGSHEWEYCRVRGRAGVRRGKTEDCESLARRGGWIYVLGSQFGAKDGPVEPKRQFVARFDESALGGRVDEEEVEVEIARGSFRLHRLLNDALRASRLELIARGPHEEKCVREARRGGKRKGKKWAQRIDAEDWPLNVEGATFLPSGSLLLGLRYPVTREGHPILVELDEIDRLFQFQGGRDPGVRRVWVLANVGSADEPRGVRGLESVGDDLHLISGSLDSEAAESALIADHPEGRKAVAQHHRCRLPKDSGWGSVEAELVAAVGEETRVEGLSVDAEGGFLYILDDERIRLRQD